ncbi:endonuclease toxin domain-containing protein [Aeoliella mucimassa]|uniref:CdiA toxin EC869-like domain-containing protein n=1 Tax=Aeoliella mucimassa TaxID=2527972 RepID=A0A518AKM4_9BACT|nr:RHS repeat-associated core domain-containing protein [Aeoliella mucimassa]QDU55280.1 hypothetical protein Pan181_14690 [Aeoliella mucimassa]
MSYDPSIGQWLSEDPIGFEAGDTNKYRYVGNTPTTFLDTTGLDRLEHGYLQVITWRQAEDLGFYDPEHRPKYRIPLYYVNEPNFFNVFGSDAPPVLVGHYYPELGFVEHTPCEGADKGLGHGYRVSLSELNSKLGNHDWSSWFKANHNDSMNNSAILKQSVDIGLNDPSIHDRFYNFETTAELLAHIDIAFYGIATGLATPSGSMATSKTALTGRRIFNKNSVWKMGAGNRGFAVEAKLGGNLPNGFKTIDRFKDGVATSIKSIDLTSKTYQDCHQLNKLIDGYIDLMAVYKGGERAGKVIRASDITSRSLEIAIPAHSMTGMQKAAIEAAVDYGKSKKVTVIIIEMF